MLCTDFTVVSVKSNGNTMRAPCFFSCDLAVTFSMHSSCMVAFVSVSTLCFGFLSRACFSFVSFEQYERRNRRDTSSRLPCAMLVMCVEDGDVHVVCLTLSQRMVEQGVVQ